MSITERPDDQLLADRTHSFRGSSPSWVYLVLVDPAFGRNVDGMYWRYETFLKMCESRLGALLGSNGAVHADYGATEALPVSEMPASEALGETF